MSQRNNETRGDREELTPLEAVVTRDILKSEVKAWAARIGVEPKEIHIRPMTRKWASCSSSGRISLNEELLAEPAEFRRQVIVHELLHLKLPNHGRLFKALLRAYCEAPAAQPAPGET